MAYQQRFCTHRRGRGGPTNPHSTAVDIASPQQDDAPAPVRPGPRTLDCQGSNPGAQPRRQPRADLPVTACRAGARLADVAPRAVRIAAGRTLHTLWTAVDIHGVGEWTAISRLAVERRARHDFPVMTAVGIAPRHRLTGLAAFERIQLGIHGQLAIAGIERTSNFTADQATDDGAKHSADDAAFALANLATQHASRDRTGYQALILFGGRSWATAGRHHTSQPHRCGGSGHPTDRSSHVPVPSVSTAFGARVQGLRCVSTSFPKLHPIIPDSGESSTPQYTTFLSQLANGRCCSGRWQVKLDLETAMLR